MTMAMAQLVWPPARARPTGGQCRRHLEIRSAPQPLCRGPPTLRVRKGSALPGPCREAREGQPGSRGCQARTGGGDGEVGPGGGVGACFLLTTCEDNVVLAVMLC